MIRTLAVADRLAPVNSNPITAIVAHVRALQNDLTRDQREVREAGRERVRRLSATGAFSVAPRTQ